MGGNALSFSTRRISSEELAKMQTEISEKISDIPHRFVRAYRTKDTHGDIDVIVETEMRLVDIAARFNPREVMNNKVFCSFDLHDVQVDLIKVNEGELDFAQAYFAWNDLGNFIGRTAKRVNMKFGHNGLFYTYRNPEFGANHVVDILVTSDPRSAFEFLGYDYDRFAEGFDTPEEIFEYATSSKYHDPYAVLSDQTYKAHRRDTKRKMFNAYMKFLESRHGEITFDYNAPKVDLLSEAISRFPELKVRLDTHDYECRKRKSFRDTFPPLEISKMFGVSGKELGVVLSNLRDQVEIHGLEHVKNQVYSAFH